MSKKKQTKGGRIDSALPFEQPLLDLEHQIQNSDSAEERRGLEMKLQEERETLYPNLSAWERVQLARHAERPRMLDYTSRIFDDVIELHGDRCLGDDAAMVTGIAQFNGKTVMFVGQQKGVSTDEKVERNFGMAQPEGYRKAMRMYEMAERFKLPIISFVDTPAAHPGVEAEQHGQGPIIAQSILQSLSTRTPIMCAIIGEGGSGGALAIAVGDYITIFEHAFYVICPPERCAEILWRDVEQKELASSALRLTAKDLHELGIVDTVMPEPGGGAHRNPDGAAQVLSEEIEQFLQKCDKGIWNLDARQDRFQRMGVWREEQPQAVVEPELREAVD